MRNAVTVMNIIRDRGQRGLPVNNLYRLLYNRDLYLRAYAKLYPTPEDYKLGVEVYDLKTGKAALAEKSGLMPANTPPDAAYAQLPTFVAVKGTIGAPKSDFKELAIGGVLLKSGVGIAEKLGVNVGKETGGILKGVGNLLTGQGTASTNATETNKAGTNAPPKRSLFDLLPKKK